MRWRVAIATAAGLAATLLLAPASGDQQEVWLTLDAPPEGAVRSGTLEWVRVEGRAGAGDRVDYDVAVVIDVSGSTALASGLDVDGDGRVGRARRRRESWRSFNPRHLSSDPGDSVLAAERLATARLVESLARTPTRFAVVAFADAGELVCPLTGDRAATAEALERVGRAFGSGATNLADATRVATRALLAADRTRGRRPVILILSDGHPTFPGSAEAAAEAAVAAAREARDRGIAIHAFGLGLQEIGPDDVFARVAALTGGRYLRVERPGEIVHDLPRMRLAEPAQVEVANRTTGRGARALRVAADGSFDAYVELAPGQNAIRVVARGERGGLRALERIVRFERREPVDAGEAERFAAERAAFHEALRLRGLEAELTLELQRARARRQRRELEVVPEEAGE